MISSLKYSLYDGIKPAIMSGVFLGLLDYFQAKNNVTTTQILIDFGTLIFSQFLVKYAVDFLPMGDYNSVGCASQKWVLTPALTSLLYEYIYRKTLAEQNKFNSSAVRSAWENYTVAGGCVAASQLLTDRVISVLM